MQIHEIIPYRTLTKPIKPCMGHVVPLRQHPYMATQIISFTNESIREKVGIAHKIQCNSSFEVYTGVWLRFFFFF
jgi:hypothetical protein